MSEQEKANNMEAGQAAETETATEADQAAKQETMTEAGAEAVQPEVESKKAKKGKKEKVKRTVGQEILSWVLTILVALVAALIIRSVIFEPVRVDGHSMDDTLADGEIMLVTKYDYSSTWLCFPWSNEQDKEAAPRFTFGGNPKQFDVVICRYPGRGDVNFVKRVIGLPGDTVKLEAGQLTVNGTAYEEVYVNDEYRSGYLNELADYLVPKKGDTFTVHLENGRYSFRLNGESWDIKSTVMRCKDGNGKQLVIRDGGKTFVYDGKTYQLSEATALKELLEKISDQAFTVNEDYYFVMGDHRNNSNDSRSQGCIERSMIIGHVRTVVYPFSKWRAVKNGLDFGK